LLRTIAADAPISIAEDRLANGLGSSQLRVTATTRCQRDIAPAGAGGCRAVVQVEVLVRFEFPAEGIPGLAREREVDLILTGVRNSTEAAVPDHSPWPVASRVVAEAQCPVLTVRG
jgi:nucleotide-binding universal stress UspA family protein